LTSRVTEQFVSRLLLEPKPVSTLTLVSPWITDWDVPTSSFSRLVGWIRVRHVRTLVITRPPIEPWHLQAAMQLARLPSATVMLLPDLHTKLFICRAVPIGFGLVGSANLTGRSLQNLEIGVMFEGRGIHSQVLNDLYSYASYDLRRLCKGRLSGGDT
jgi:phosphatidylserine/phosphatidylglycerophosphate/cardiolipin synthase-like enzyme